jgi:hypothetical protein
MFMASKGKYQMTCAPQLPRCRGNYLNFQNYAYVNELNPNLYAHMWGSFHYIVEFWGIYPS